MVVVDVSLDRNLCIDRVILERWSCTVIIQVIQDDLFELLQLHL